MPKIQQIPSHNEQSFQMQNIQRRNFSPLINDNSSRLKKKSMHDSVVPIHEVSYNPQFSKSPLACVQISRKAHIQPIEAYPEESVYYDFQPKTVQLTTQSKKMNWKTILCWILVIFAIVGFIVGLYFLVDAILGHKSSEKTNDTSSNDQIYSSVGVTPIYVSPIPYNNLPSSSAPVSNPSTSPSISYNSPSTYPSTLPSQTDQNSAPLVQQKSSKNEVQSSAQWNSDSLQNSIQPINVYETKQT